MKIHGMEYFKIYKEVPGLLDLIFEVVTQKNSSFVSGRHSADGAQQAAACLNLQRKCLGMCLYYVHR
jgi:hypothetical protein